MRAMFNFRFNVIGYVVVVVVVLLARPTFDIIKCLTAQELRAMIRERRVSIG